MAALPPHTELRVPFLDLGRTNARVKDTILAEIEDLIDSGTFTNGPQVAEFERAFAAYCRVSECVGLSSGLDGLRLSLLAAGIELGDEVLVPANTFIATFEAITQAGGVPVPVDVSMHDYNIDPALAEAAITVRTRFVLPVHLYGQMADMHTLIGLAGRHNLIAIEDACQAHGAERDGLRAGAAGRAAAFSFYPGKNLGGFGDGGAIVTSDSTLATSVRALREHGQRTKYAHDVPGYTARLDSIQAIVLMHKLALLEDGNLERRSTAKYYSDALGGVGDIRTPPEPSGSTPAWHIYAIYTDSRDALVRHLQTSGVATGLHYPEPPHLSRAYASLGHLSGEFPVTESLASRLLSLPIFPGIRQDELHHVTRSIAAFYRG
jgi:dTDP-4-amino-4,6-dideoxygalactose transaminase